MATSSIISEGNRCLKALVVLSSQETLLMSSLVLYQGWVSRTSINSKLICRGRERCLVTRVAKHATAAGNNFAPDYGRFAPEQRARLRRAKRSAFSRKSKFGSDIHTPGHQEYLHTKFHHRTTSNKKVRKTGCAPISRQK